MIEMKRGNLAYHYNHEKYRYELYCNDRYICCAYIGALDRVKVFDEVCNGYEWLFRKLVMEVIAEGIEEMEPEEAYKTLLKFME